MLIFGSKFFTKEMVILHYIHNSKVKIIATLNGGKFKVHFLILHFKLLLGPLLETYLELVLKLPTTQVSE